MMAWVPIVFYACRDRWPMNRFIKATLLIGGLSIAAFLVVLGVNILMASSAEHVDLITAFKIILSHYEVRLGTPLLDSHNFYDPTLVERPESVNAEIWPIIDVYLRGYVQGPGFSDAGIDWPPTFEDLIVAALDLGVLILIICAAMNPVSTRMRTLAALVAAMGAGFLASLSWHILMHQHSYIHRHMNFVLWYLPFLLLFYALAGEIVVGALYRIFRSVVRPHLAKLF
jgi:hypothetical protein